MSRLLRPIALLAVLVAAVAVAGCGGQKVAADEVPGDPVNLTVPEVTKGGSASLAGGSNSSSSSSSASADATATATATPDQSASGTSTPNQSSGTQSTGTSGTTQSGTTGGTGTTQQQQQTQTQTQTNGNSGTSGNNTGKPFDDFCKNNPGAC
jgi:hypothetical protein